MKLIKDSKNKMTLKKGLLLAGVTGASIALLSQPALAAQKSKQYHEEEWKKTKTYGNTIIAEDSMTEWGPWNQFVQPAAGPLAIAPMPGMRTDGASYYRPESVEEFSPKYRLAGVDVDVCQGGEWCGYMAYSTYSYSSDDEGDGSEGGPYPGRIGLRLTPDDPSAYDTDGTVAYRVSNLYDPGTVVNESGEIPVEFWFLANFTTPRVKGLGHVIRGDYPVAPGEDGQSTAGTAWQWTLEENGDWYTETGFYAPFVAGIATPLSEMANFNAGNVEGSYYGFASDHNTPVQIDVNFGAATWSGTWNDGADGSDIHVYSNTNGEKYVTGDVGFRASGTINGANIQSTGVSADDGSVTGTVVGNFFGTGGEVLGGISDITKTTEDYDAARNVDTFVTCAGEFCENNRPRL